MKKRSLLGCMKRVFFPVIAAISVFITYPTLIDYQDVASLDPDFKGPRWMASIMPAPGISELFGNENGRKAKVVNHQQAEDSPKKVELAQRLTTRIKTSRDPQTVNRTLKGNRVVTTTVKAAPNKFSAGRVVERHSMLEPLNVGKNLERAFVKAKPYEEAIEIASLFHPKKAKQTALPIDPNLPVLVAKLVRESESNILAFAPEPELKRSPFAEILKDNTPINIIPKLGKGDHEWAANPLPKSVFSDGEQHCLAAGIYFEARGEPVKGQAAVSQVILNRVKNPTYPNTICGVVYQNKTWRNRCQFSFACDTIKDKINDRKRWEVAQYVAKETTEGRIWLKEVGSSTHYHATYVSPRWANSMKRVGRIGLHIFYRTFGGGWS